MRRPSRIKPNNQGPPKVSTNSSSAVLQLGMWYLSEMHLYGHGVSVTPPVKILNVVKELNYSEKTTKFCNKTLNTETEKEWARASRLRKSLVLKKLLNKAPNEKSSIFHQKVTHARFGDTSYSNIFRTVWKLVRKAILTKGFIRSSDVLKSANRAFLRCQFAK